MLNRVTVNAVPTTIDSMIRQEATPAAIRGHPLWHAIADVAIEPGQTRRPLLAN